jgi:transposase
MRPLTLSDPTIVLSLQDQVRRSPEARYDHRLHGLLMLAHGVSCPEVAAILGDAPRTVQYWVHRFEQDGLQGLAEHDRPGRPARLSTAQCAHLERVLRQPPAAAGFPGAIWGGKTLAAYVERRFHLTLGVRQCQRLFRHWGFQLRKTRLVIAQAAPARHDVAKEDPRRP